MGRTATVARETSRKNNAAIVKAATDAAKKTAKKEAAKVADSTARKTASRVAAKVALDPDYTEVPEGEEDTTLDFGEGAYASEEEEDFDDVRPSSRILGSFHASEDDDTPAAQEDTDDDGDNSEKVPDVFAVARECSLKGTPIRITIKKNGHFLTTIKKPYSVEEMQKDHGEGHYTVILKNDAKGTFIKQNSFSLAAPPVDPLAIVQTQVAAKQDEKFETMFTTFSEMSQRQQESQAQMMERLLEQQREREEQAEERRREEKDAMKEQEKQNQNLLAVVLQGAFAKKDEGGGSMAAVMQMMQASQQQTTQLMMEMSKSNMMMIQEMRRDTQSMFEKISQMNQEQTREFRNQLSEMANKKEDGFDAIKMFQILNDSRKEGMDFGLKINQIAKDLAEDGEVTERQPKGVVESILDNLGKFAPAMIAMSQQQNASQHFPQQPQITVAPQRPALVPAPAAPSFKRPAPAPAPVAKTPVRSNPVTTTAARVNPATPVATATVKPVVTPKAPAKRATTNVPVASGPEAGKIATDKEKIISVCVPLISHALVNQLPSGDLGQATLNAAAELGISAKKLVSEFSLDELFYLAFVTHKLPKMPELENYFKDYYDYLQQKASQS